MEFFVNNEKIDITLENEKTIGDILKAFEAECSANNATTVEIAINGKKINANDFDSVVGMPITDDLKIELVIVTLSEINKAFEGIANNCDVLVEKLEQVSVLIQSGKDRDVNHLIQQTADLISNFCHVVNYSTLFPREYGKVLIEGKTVSDFFAEFSPILHDFEDALSSKDTVLIGDLAEYEIAPRVRAISTAIRR